MRFIGATVVLLFTQAISVSAEPPVRARDLGVPFEGITGPWNALTDLKTVQLGHLTIIKSNGAHAARTGVTAIFPLGNNTDQRVPAAVFSLNGNGEMTGTAWVDESGFLEGPVLLTNTFSVGTVRDAVVEWGLKHFPKSENFSLPVVAETWDGLLNDINGFHVSKKQVMNLLDQTKNAPIPEGNVGGGTGMVAFQFKGGIGTASRQIEAAGRRYLVGVLVQANFGRRPQLSVAGVPVGRLIEDLMPVEQPKKDGSIIIVIGTDAPLLPHQIRRITKRAALGLARTGSVATNSSGDLFVAFSTSVPQGAEDGPQTWAALPNDLLDDLFTATVQATEESILNALVAAETMTGVNGNTVYALPHDRLSAIIRDHNRLNVRHP